MIVRTRAAGALVAAALIAATPAAAATFTQTKAFERFTDLNATTPSYNLESVESFPLHFDAFDSSLGALTGVSWQLTSTQHYEVGLGLVSPAALATSEFSGSTSVSGGGETLGAGPQVFRTASCITFPSGICFYVDISGYDVGFTRSAAALAPYLLAGGVDASLGSIFTLRGKALGGEIVSNFAGASLEWNGALSLVYSYDAAPPGPGVPEPSAWALMLAGFGLAGAALRRRETASA